jgi:hypothetical protein
MLKKCKIDTTCYLDEIEKSENQSKDGQLKGIKAGYMLGVLGDEKTGAELVKRLDAVDNAAVRFVAAMVIDRTLPKGSGPAADALKEIIEKNTKSADKEKIAGDSPVKEVLYRLQSRGG